MFASDNQLPLVRTCYSFKGSEHRSEGTDALREGNQSELVLLLIFFTTGTSFRFEFLHQMETPPSASIKQLRAHDAIFSKDHFFPYSRAELDVAMSNKEPKITVAYQNSRVRSLTCGNPAVGSPGLTCLSTVPENQAAAFCSVVLSTWLPLRSSRGLFKLRPPRSCCARGRREGEEPPLFKDFGKFLARLLLISYWTDVGHMTTSSYREVRKYSLLDRDGSHYKPRVLLRKKRRKDTGRKPLCHRGLFYL